MRKGLLLIFFMGWLFGPPSKVQVAYDNYKAGKYLDAAKTYASETPNYPDQAPAMNFNTGQGYFFADSLQLAMTQFGKVCNMSTQDPELGSIAWNNVGILHLVSLEQAQKQAQQAQQQGMQAGTMQGAQPSAPNQEEMKAKMMIALQAFKDALKLDHNNDIARYNYELLMRRIKQQEQQQQQQQDQQQEQQDQQQEQQENQEQNKPDQGQDQENDSQPKEEKNANQDPNKQGQGEGQGKESQMSGEEAQRLLEAMNSNEKKFLQQLEKGKKRKVYSEKDGHDW